jgi:hypothetical protein
MLVSISNASPSVFNSTAPTGPTGAPMPPQVDMRGNQYVKSGVRYARVITPSPTGVPLSTSACAGVTVSLDGAVVQGELADDPGFIYNTAPLAANLEHPYEFRTVYSLIPSCICHALWNRKP